ncbi:MAG: ABC transporter ATP-binding protein [Pseudobdellovibrionaceae bacterium]
MIEANGLGHAFQHEASVFSQFDFQIQPFEFVTLLGPSGCGKSTLLRIIGDLQKPSQGSIQVSAQRKSFVFQEPRLLPWRTCLENTLLPLEIHQGQGSGRDNQKLAEETLASLGLQGAISKFPQELSGGMKMRCALARSLMVQPDLMLLDEPFAALDEHTRLKLQIELRALFLQKKWTVIFVTHSIEEACFLSDRIFLFRKDRKSLSEHKSRLPVDRDAKFHDDLRFFEEVSLVRKRFQAETL